MQEHSGPARVFNSEETAIAAIYAQPLIAGGQGGGLSGQATDIKIHADHIIQIGRAHV